jgi:hypothetical protein
MDLIRIFWKISTLAWTVTASAPIVHIAMTLEKTPSD